MQEELKNGLEQLNEVLQKGEVVECVMFDKEYSNRRNLIHKSLLKYPIPWTQARELLKKIRLVGFLSWEFMQRKYKVVIWTNLNIITTESDEATEFFIILPRYPEKI